MKQEINETRLENGLTVITDRMQGVRSATLGFFYRVGSRNEPDELNGISHFIEHAVFKGTNSRTALEIAIEQDRLGGNLDAFTTHEETGFAIKVIDDQLPAAFDLIADMLMFPKFDPKDLESEQRVIIEEIKMTDDSPEELLGELFYRGFFPGHPLGLSIAGTPETVRSFARENTSLYHANRFHSGNLIVTAAGNVDHSGLVELVTKAVTGSAVAGSDFANSVPAGFAPTPAAPIVIEHKADLEQAHLILAVPFVSARDDRRYAADLLANVIGGGTSSRLWQKVREERGLAYSVGASSAMFNDCGIFSVFAGTSPEQVGEVVDIVMDEMRWVVRNGITAGELQLMKDQTRASILLGLEDSAARAATLAQSEMIHSCQIPVEETLANIEAVTAEDLHSIAAEFFKTDAVAFAAIGELNGLSIDRDRLSVG
jgi:predicted Zn-dependent peptidase